MSRSGVSRSLLLAVAIACGAPLAIASAAPQQKAAEVRYNGGTWRGSIGDRIEVQFRETGKDQTATGVLLAIERYALTLEIQLEGRTAKKVIILGDVKSVKSADGGATKPADAPAASGTTGESKDAAAPATTPTKEASASAPNSKPVGLIEHPDTAGSISTPRTDGKKTVFILPLGGQLGTLMRHDEVKALEKQIDKLGEGQIVVLRINSGGGLVTEGDLMHEVLVRLKKKHRLCAWIEEAISGAAFTALHADEIYFMDVGSLGAIAMGSGGISVKGAQLDAWLDKIYEICELGGRPGFICRCMVHTSFEASYDIDPDTGKVIWHQDQSGKYIVSTEKDNLSFNATDAVRSKFAQGRANTEYELFKAMQLDDGTYVVSDLGKKIAGEWKRTAEACSYEVPRLMQDYQVKGAGLRDPEQRLSIQIATMKKIIAWWDRAPNIMMYELNARPKAYYEEILKELQKELADLKKEKAKERRTG